MTTTTAIHPVTAQRSDRTITIIEQPSGEPFEVGLQLVDVVANRRFDELEALIHPEARLRSLNAAGPIEVHGPRDVTAVFEGWYADADPFELVTSWVRHMTDRIQVSWQFAGEKPGHDGPENVEQHLFIKVVDGQILRIDMVCSGFRPRG